MSRRPPLTQAERVGGGLTVARGLSSERLSAGPVTVLLRSVTQAAPWQAQY